MREKLMPPPLRIFALTALAMIAFAANSVLARLALSGESSIDPISYTATRLFSAAAILALIVHFRGLTKRKRPMDYLSIVTLFGYAAVFSLAYLRLDTAMGALVLFGVVQMTMISAGLVKGERLTRLQWVGIAIACAAFTYLMLPGLSAPDPLGAALMALSGLCWGIYSLAGQSGGDPLLRTADNFIGTLPLAFVAGGFYLWLGFADIHLSYSGVWLAVISGAVMSGMGYAIWYSAVTGLSAAQGGIVQLSVPIIAAIGGVIFVSEPLSMRLCISALLILGGIALTMVRPRA